ncbi:Anhydro-n-acetylmuramic acid kinase [Fusarium acuminatum]|uniref:Anhydro-n-acetylmuramic acid kinase n=1 Tax=Fusarium acuminatum TaxID=5515 RepID=A0ABZ2XDY2_9HYPO
MARPSAQQNGHSSTNSLPSDPQGQSSNGNGHHQQSTSTALNLTVLGMNSGTAMDGIDCALVRYYQQTPEDALHMELLKYDEMPVPQWIKKPVLTMLRETKTTPSKMSQLNVQLGEMFGHAVKDFCDKHDIPIDSIDLIGSHGQTIWLLSMPEEGETRSALDCGPGNMFIDNAMRYFTNGEMEYDKDGEWSSRGTVCQDIVDKFLNTNKYCNHIPPKTTGRETFGDNEGQELIDQCLAAGCDKYDTLATITRITAQNIVKQYRTFFPRFGISLDRISEVYMCGGGARNPTIITYLREQLPGTEIRALDETGVPSDAKEAVSFAQQAMEAILGRAALVPVNSDSLVPNTISGKIAPGRKWRDIMKLGIAFGEGRSIMPTVKEIIVEKPYTAWKSMQAFN